MTELKKELSLDQIIARDPSLTQFEQNAYGTLLHSLRNEAKIMARGIARQEKHDQEANDSELGKLKKNPDAYVVTPADELRSYNKLISGFSEYIVKNKDKL